MSTVGVANALDVNRHVGCDLTCPLDCVRLSPFDRARTAGPAATGCVTAIRTTLDVELIVSHVLLPRCALGASLLRRGRTLAYQHRSMFVASLEQEEIVRVGPSARHPQAQLARCHDASCPTAESRNRAPPRSAAFSSAKLCPGFSNFAPPPRGKSYTRQVIGFACKSEPPHPISRTLIEAENSSTPEGSRRWSGAPPNPPRLTVPQTAGTGYREIHGTTLVHRTCKPSQC